MPKTLEPPTTFLSVPPVSLNQAIQEAVIQARLACQNEGDQSGACAVAWDIVEELQAERSHRKQNEPAKHSLEQYCDENPDAVECRIYDV